MAKKCVSDDLEIKKWHPPFYGLITNELCFSTGLYITQSKDIDEQKIYWKWWNQPNDENSIQWLT
ncbi:hypothetical protein FNW02_19600 [Komarekiella sp. 'clone 1']|uniref:Uncharacterized protein n=1 Tax=Komarekiella delphini-convector SJRDD-AB1 TaxID=2593771 RepID=A0AA40VS96_9NOST|nr:hypothetical protein [Komarekiella delphini-convector SJRDD-AB1]